MVTDNQTFTTVITAEEQSVRNIGISGKSAPNGIIGAVCIAMGILIFTGDIRVWKKLENLKKERGVRE